MILASACTLLSACVAVFYVFFSFFFQKTQEDIEYVLRNTSQQYQAHMQFIEDSVITIRHNTVLDDFFRRKTMIQMKLNLSFPIAWSCFHSGTWWTGSCPL